MSLLLAPLRESVGRHNRAIQGLKDGSLIVTLTFKTEAEIRALNWPDVCQACVHVWLNPSQGKEVAR